MKKIAFRAITIVVIAFLVSCGNKTKEADDYVCKGNLRKRQSYMNKLPSMVTGMPVSG